MLAKIIKTMDELEDESNSRFAKIDYWNKRFTTEESYDWLLEYDHVENDLSSLLKFSDRILIVGCGNSSFSRKLYDAGFKKIVNIDYSSVVIERMLNSNISSCPEMEWITMDMTDLKFPNEYFDVVIDKAAMDALVVNEGDVWDPNQDVKISVHKMCSEVRRVLKPSDSKFIQISFAQPHFRTKYLMGYRANDNDIDVSPYESHTGVSELYKWDLQFHTITKGSGCLDSFIYIMTTQ